MSFRFIADEITALDQATGFEKKMIQNPNGYYFLEAPEIPAVICKIGPSGNLGVKSTVDSCWEDFGDV